MGQKIKSFVSVLLVVVSSVLIVGGALIAVLARWFAHKFGGVGIEQIIFTINAPLKGSNTDVVGEAVNYCLPEVLIAGIAVAALIVFYAAFLSKVNVRLSGNIGKWHWSLDPVLLVQIALVVAGIFMTTTAYASLDKTLGITEYNKKMAHATKIYEKNYVVPDANNITQTTSSKRNVIWIFMESMETTYASQAVGGHQPYYNYIQNLTNLANQNVSFSNSNNLGGFHSTTGTTWTMGSLFAQTSGIPWRMPMSNHNGMNTRKRFSNGDVSIGDILHQKGYTQEFMCGSDSDFAGRDIYFKQHGHYKIFDLNTAKKRGYIPKDYHVWWGYEDAKLYEYAKTEVTTLANGNKPFNLTMLTVDTHFPHGYLCQNCQQLYGTQAANVVNCADRQVNDFVNWAKTQPWYANTTIVITGDHPRMDSDLVAGVSYYDRTIYNCIINGVNDDKQHLKNREFTPMDMYPTVLSSMGYHIKNGRLGLGTNLYTGQKTLAERMGFEKLNKELGKRSDYYVKHFY